MWTWSYNGADDLATTSVIITASDEDGDSAIATFDLTVNNVAPTVAVDTASVTINEGQTATNSGTYGDVPADTVTLIASIGTVALQRRHVDVVLQRHGRPRDHECDYYCQ